MSTVLLVTYGIVLVALSWLAVRARRTALHKSTVDTKLTGYDVAYLRGGQQRVAEAAIARLLHAGQLRTTRLGGLVRTENATAEGSVEEAVLAAAPLSSPATVAALSARVIKRGGLLPLADKLIANGLATGAQDRKRTVLYALPLLALAVFGMFAVWIPLVLPPIAVFALVCRPLGTATRTGARLAEETKLDHPAAGPVASHGFQHFPDESLRLYAQDLRRAKVPQIRPTARPKGQKRSKRDIHTCSTGGGGNYSACSGGGGGGD
ncbi:TIGR04222 domain-containing membrane protein [Allokutzneria sp. A3M-2-11 16]|uniref:TIGR04222 domain-containing membrane protein n=1 Tax=Allokutzneria sp. A3M-2-11 16 TaxID=2962043 RepID=UPI0020B8E44F|nr:TIGR04222 domain-containing membrane protein [Allokutzneria sp. A3M-2-11 16]MCP3804539.1 TIGR04222 domain-containing membrane protein [Allokutzneria sp. A3M-2-11 16]